jgi:hypothetical protein
VTEEFTTKTPRHKVERRTRLAVGRTGEFATRIQSHAGSGQFRSQKPECRIAKERDREIEGESGRGRIPAHDSGPELETAKAAKNAKARTRSGPDNSEVRNQKQECRVTEEFTTRHALSEVEGTPRHKVGSKTRLRDLPMAKASDS